MSGPARALAAVAVLGLGGLVAGAGPGPVACAGAPAASRGAEDSGGMLEPVDLRPFRLVYRQMEGTHLKAPGGVWVDQARGEVWQGRVNDHLQGAELEEACALDEPVQKLLHAASVRLGWSARAYHRVLKVARTIADLADSDRLETHHVAEAIQYRRSLRDN